MAEPAVFHDLNNEQADGAACIVCNADFFTSGRHAAPVGISGATRVQVFACVEPCAPAVGYVEPAGEQMELQP
jgi:hypothetical protein